MTILWRILLSMTLVLSIALGAIIWFQAGTVARLARTNADLTRSYRINMERLTALEENNERIARQMQIVALAGGRLSYPAARRFVQELERLAN